MSVQAEQAAAGGGPDTRHHHHGHHNHAHHHVNPHAVTAPLFRAPVRVSLRSDFILILLFLSTYRWSIARYSASFPLPGRGQIKGSRAVKDAVSLVFSTRNASSSVFNSRNWSERNTHTYTYIFFFRSCTICKNEDTYRIVLPRVKRLAWQITHWFVTRVSILSFVSRCVELISQLVHLYKRETSLKLVSNCCDTRINEI